MHDRSDWNAKLGELKCTIGDKVVLLLSEKIVVLLILYESSQMKPLEYTERIEWYKGKKKTYYVVDYFLYSVVN